ncbi:hypothetical protein KZX46_10185 [Polymorphobacter sp. PAMC 29334]|uniref:hypothetical protein n=1 Tax=Polymorphobacter sp. PAMC 29334 TaxID=2862331 RepID=UPI001C75F2E7|nr:hypothetical protein [Polymorphobacter sp. PAMC 29334]QYE36262.1 hypothetical protein KZX46_10185 [Polymorphobacter sp. PAMC 29334]
MNLSVLSGAAVLMLASVAAIADPVTPVVPADSTAGPPVEHRLSPADADAAIEAGAERNRAAEALATARLDPALQLPGEDRPRDKKLHGEAGVAFGSNGEREVFGTVNTSLGGDSTASFSYDNTQFGRQRYRTR